MLLGASISESAKSKDPWTAYFLAIESKPVADVIERAGTSEDQADG
jgi:hypothetical protein